MTYWVRSPTSIFSDPVRAAMAEAGRTPTPPSRLFAISVRGSLRLPAAYSLSSPLHDLPSWTTY